MQAGKSVNTHRIQGAGKHADISLYLAVKTFVTAVGDQPGETPGCLEVLVACIEFVNNNRWEEGAEDAAKTLRPFYCACARLVTAPRLPTQFGEFMRNIQTCRCSTSLKLAPLQSQKLHSAGRAAIRT